MTVTAIPQRLALPNEKPAPSVERVMVGNDVLLSVFDWLADADENEVVKAGVFDACRGGQIRSWEPSTAPSGAVVDDIAIIVSFWLFALRKVKEGGETRLWASTQSAIGAGGGGLGLGFGESSHASKSGGCGGDVGVHGVLFLLVFGSDYRDPVGWQVSAVKSGAAGVTTNRPTESKRFDLGDKINDGITDDADCGECTAAGHGIHPVSTAVSHLRFKAKADDGNRIANGGKNHHVSDNNREDCITLDVFAGADAVRHGCTINPTAWVYKKNLKLFSRPISGSFAQRIALAPLPLNIPRQCPPSIIHRSHRLPRPESW